MPAIMTRLALGLALSTGIGLLAYRRQSLSHSGVLGAILTGTLIFGLGGWLWGVLLVVFFASSSALSRYRNRDKEPLAEKFAKGSRRDLGQALANGGLGAVFAVLMALRPDPLWLAGFVGAMATVNADTWATELGVLSRSRPRLITTGEVVEAGTSGAVTALGSAAALGGAALIGLVTGLGFVLGLERGPAELPLFAAIAGLLGSLFDSLLGATVQAIYYCDVCGKETERRNHRFGHPTRLLRGWWWLNNDLVNFFSSAVGAGLAMLFTALAQGR